jgi:tRNA(Phe) wybutosine-synthesizing methylase Tyw3
MQQEYRPNHVSENIAHKIYHNIKVHLLVIYIFLDLINARKMERIKSTKQCSGRIIVYVQKCHSEAENPLLYSCHALNICPHRHVHIGFGARNIPDGLFQRR